METTGVFAEIVKAATFFLIVGLGLFMVWKTKRIADEMMEDD